MNISRIGSRTLGWACSLLLLGGAVTSDADTLKLKNGTTEQGEIVAEDATQFTIEIQNASGTVSFKHSIKKSDVAEVIRATPEQRAALQLQRDYAALQKYQLGANSFPAAYYDQVLTALRDFQAQHPAAAHQQDIAAKILAWQTEASQVATGMVKYQSQWITAQAWRDQWQQQQAQQGLEQAQILVRQSRFADAIQAFKQLELGKQPTVATTATQLKAETYKTWLSYLQSQLQLTTGDAQLYETRLRQAAESTKRARENLVAFKNTHGDTGIGYRGLLNQHEGAVQRAEAEEKNCEIQLGQLREHSIAMQRQLGHVQAQAVGDLPGISIADLLASNSNTNPASTNAPPAAPPPAPTPGVLDQIADVFKRYWIAGVAAVLGLIWGASRLFGRD